MDKDLWRSYSDLAWTETIIAPPENFVEETTLLCNFIKEHSLIEARTLLHLGSGAGILFGLKNRGEKVHSLSQGKEEHPQDKGQKHQQA
jgi:hypothetical protein